MEEEEEEKEEEEEEGKLGSKKRAKFFSLFLSLYKTKQQNPCIWLI